jgi:hypothetical protein
MDEQEDTAPDGVEAQKNTPRGIGIVLGIAGLMMMTVAGMVVFGFFGPVSEAWRPGRSNAPFAITLDAAGIDAELARLRGLPGEPLPADLGAVARARVACTVELLAARPGPAAVEAASRYYLIVSAMRKHVPSPLIDPRTREVSLGGIDSFDDPVQLVKTGQITEARFREWDRLVASYRQGSHPIYTGLQLEQSTWASADFGEIVAVEHANAERVRTCYRARAGG